MNSTNTSKKDFKNVTLELCVRDIAVCIKCMNAFKYIYDGTPISLSPECPNCKTRHSLEWITLTEEQIRDKVRKAEKEIERQEKEK